MDFINNLAYLSTYPYIKNLIINPIKLKKSIFNFYIYLTYKYNRILSLIIHICLKSFNIYNKVLVAYYLNDIFNLHT